MAWPTTSRHDRGYGNDWNRLRARVLKRDNGLCQCKHCKAEQRIRLATEVDHIVSKAEAQRRGWSKQRTDHPDNLQAIAKACHQRKTIEEQGGEPRERIGLDGYPVK